VSRAYKEAFVDNTIIRVDRLRKTFKVSKRPRGFLGHVANLFFPMYETKTAVSGVSFEIKKGESVGLIGANGAGKSTAMKILSGILYPDSGSIEVAGFVPYRQRREYVANIGAVFGQKSQLSWDLPVIDSFDLLKHIYRVPDETYHSNLACFTELLDLSSFIHQPVRQLSLGQRMRADITAALIHSPQIVFFDEPTIGLDVVVKERIREFVCRLNRERGVTILFTTHDMQDIERTCKRLITIDQGAKLYDGTVDGIMDKYSRERKLVVEFTDECPIRARPDVTLEDLGGCKKAFLYDPGKVSTKDLIAEITAAHDVRDITVERAGIDSIVRRIYEGTIALS
jgi:ABC-2 type transport system ATP-binding protein